MLRKSDNELNSELSKLKHLCFIANHQINLNIKRESGKHSVSTDCVSEQSQFFCKIYCKGYQREKKDHGTDFHTAWTCVKYKFPMKRLREKKFQCLSFLVSDVVCGFGDVGNSAQICQRWLIIHWSKFNVAQNELFYYENIMNVFLPQQNLWSRENTLRQHEEEKIAKKKKGPILLWIMWWRWVLEWKDAQAEEEAGKFRNLGSIIIMLSIRERSSRRWVMSTEGIRVKGYEGVPEVQGSRATLHSPDISYEQCI